jgi:CheY-like chemotaxis protein
MFTQPSVLLIDDDRDIVHATSLRLRALGFRTDTAHDGREGLQKARTLLPQAILLDVRMPDLDGLQILDQLQDDPKTRDIPIVMLSASLVDCQAALDSGASYFISKPYAWSQLLAALETVLQKQQYV